MVGNAWFAVTGGLFLGRDVQEVETELGAASWFPRISATRFSPAGPTRSNHAFGSREVFNTEVASLLHSMVTTRRRLKNTAHRLLVASISNVDVSIHP